MLENQVSGITQVMLKRILTYSSVRDADCNVRNRHIAIVKNLTI